MKFYPHSVTIKKIQNTAMGAFICALTIAIPFSYFTSPKTAHAGLFSLISDLGSDEVLAKSVETTSSVSSQNMILLQAPVNSDPNSRKTHDTTLLAYGNALSAEIGPQGTAADITDTVSTQISFYTVREGDTLSSIADMFNVSINTILWANELTKSGAIKEGQKLIILPISGIKYTVKKGDTIKGIVFRYKANLNEVLQYNDLTLLSTINAGDVIVIPDAEPTAQLTPKIAQSRTTISASTNKAHNINGPFYPGYFIRPIVGGTKSQDLHGYNGIDLAAPVGTVIRASASGKVISSISNGAWNGGYGNFVIVSHDNDTQTLYAHTQKNFVSVGDTVEQGQMIAKVGMTGKTTGAHLHFEIRGAKNPF